MPQKKDLEGLLREQERVHAKGEKLTAVVNEIGRVLAESNRISRDADPLFKKLATLNAKETKRLEAYDARQKALLKKIDVLTAKGWRTAAK